jgi:hypothetical protein
MKHVIIYILQYTYLHMNTIEYVKIRKKKYFDYTLHTIK